MDVSRIRDFPWHAQRTGGHFRNLDTDAVRGWKEVLRWKLGLGPAEARPRCHDLPFVPEISAPNDATISHPGPEYITATWIGHSTFLLQIGGHCFLTDPNFSSTCPPVPLLGFRRKSPPGLRVHEFPPIDAVLLSHDHYDHMDRPTLLALGHDTKIVCPTGVGARLARWNFRDVTEMSWGQAANCFDVRVSCLPAQHGSGRGPFHRNETLWCSWLIEYGGGKSFF